MISALPSVSTLAAADQLVLLSASLGNDARATLATLLAWLQSQLTSTGSVVTQYASPAATGFSITLSPPVNGNSLFLLLTPIGAYAAGTILLPAQSTCVDSQTVLCHSTQAVTALTVNGNGATAVNGAPTTLAQFGYFRLRYDGPSKSWYRTD